MSALMEYGWVGGLVGGWVWSALTTHHLSADVMDDSNDDGEVLMVERISEHRGTTKNRRKFFVFWEGYPDEPTWETEMNLINNTVYLEYIAQLPAPPPTARQAAKAKAGPLAPTPSFPPPSCPRPNRSGDAVSSLQQVSQCRCPPTTCNSLYSPASTSTPFPPPPLSLSFTVRGQQPDWWVQAP